MHSKILIIDFGSQYTQLIARAIRELNVYCEIQPFNRVDAMDDSIKGLILSGSPFSINDPNAPKFGINDFRGKIPILGIGFGAYLLTEGYETHSASSTLKSYGKAFLTVQDTQSRLFRGIPAQTEAWVSHGHYLNSLPSPWKVVARTENDSIAAFEAINEPTFGLQFHPEVYHTTKGLDLIRNFVIDICKCQQNWTPAAFVRETIAELRSQLGNDQVILGLSGGVDSSVAALLLHRAIGPKLTCIFVNHGLLRKGEYEQVLESYKTLGLNVIGVDASQKFYNGLRGITDPEQKRKSIGRDFIEVFEMEASKISDVKWLGQGTIYPDVVESVSISASGKPAKIKSHHNVGGLPEKMRLKIVEPLRLLFKDEVRRVGYELGLPQIILGRHPFPGPGLGIRILGEVTAEKVKVLQEADSIYIEGLRQADLYDKIWQAGAILLPVQSVGVMGDERTYEHVVALRAVTSIDGMTADCYPLPHDFLAHISNEIIHKVKGINRVVYDISAKPPATIEWE